MKTCFHSQHVPNRRENMAQVAQPDTNFSKKFLKKHFPLSEDNMYGIIPLGGLGLSLNFAYMYVTHFAPHYSIWSGSLLCFAILTFTSIQTFWGFQAKRVKLLELWIKSKGVEAIFTVIAIISLSCHSHMFVIGDVVNLTLALVMVYVGFEKYKSVTQSESTPRG